MILNLFYPKVRLVFIEDLQIFNSSNNNFLTLFHFQKIISNSFLILLKMNEVSQKLFKSFHRFKNLIK
jgi:hypothetical protein